MGCTSSCEVREPVATETAIARSSTSPQSSAAESPRASAPDSPLVRAASSTSSVVNTLFSSPSPPARERRISAELSRLSIVDNKGRLSVEFSRDLRESFGGSRVSASLADNGSKHVLVYGNDGSPPLLLKRLVGKGGFGSVFVGEWDGIEVAVKVVAAKEQGNIMDTLAQAKEDQHQQMSQLEAILMAIVDHENIVRTFKVMCGTDAPPQQAENQVEHQVAGSLSFYIVMENAQFGSLWSGLVAGRFHAAAPDASLRVSTSESRASWDAWAAIETLKEVVSGLMYLHGQGVIHGDLKAANVLLCASDKDRRGFISKLTDFGFSRIATGSDTRSFAMRTNTYGTVTHMPPELLSEGVLTATADIYSIGIIMWEVYMGRAVFKDLTDLEVINEVVCNRLRPDFPSDTPASFKRLAQSCWSENLMGRPPLEVVLSQLDAIQQELCPEGPSSSSMVISGCTAPQNRRKSLQCPVKAKSCQSDPAQRRMSMDAGGQDMHVQVSTQPHIPHHTHGKFSPINELQPQRSQPSASWI